MMKPFHTTTNTILNTTATFKALYIAKDHQSLSFRIAQYIAVEHLYAIYTRRDEQHRLGFQQKWVSTVKSCDRPPCVLTPKPKPLGSYHKRDIPNTKLCE